MSDELLLILANMADISPKKVALIIDTYEKSAGYEPVPEDYDVFKYECKCYAYKSLGDGPWTPQCASLELMKVLRNYFISSGKMVEGGCWPGSGDHWAWTRDVYSYGDHVELNSYGGTNHYYDGDLSARFAVLPLDSEGKNFIKEASHENETI